MAHSKTLCLSFGNYPSSAIYYKLSVICHRLSATDDDISLTRFVIPGLTEPAPYSIRGNPVSKIMVPCLRRDGVWIPAGVYPVLDTGQE